MSELTFEAVEINWEWFGTPKWYDMYVPVVRISLSLLTRDQHDLEDAVKRMIEADLLEDFIDGHCDAREHLQRTVELLDVVFARLERAECGMGEA